MLGRRFFLHSPDPAALTFLSRCNVQHLSCSENIYSLSLFPLPSDISKEGSRCTAPLVLKDSEQVAFTANWASGVRSSETAALSSILVPPGTSP
jgi:hypothetical protein